MDGRAQVTAFIDEFDRLHPGDSHTVSIDDDLKLELAKSRTREGFGSIFAVGSQSDGWAGDHAAGDLNQRNLAMVGPGRWIRRKHLGLRVDVPPEARRGYLRYAITHALDAVGPEGAADTRTRSDSGRLTRAQSHLAQALTKIGVAGDALFRFDGGYLVGCDAGTATDSIPTGRHGEPRYSQLHLVADKRGAIVLRASTPRGCFPSNWVERMNDRPNRMLQRMVLVDVSESEGDEAQVPFSIVDMHVGQLTAPILSRVLDAATFEGSVRDDQWIPNVPLIPLEALADTPSESPLEIVEWTPRPLLFMPEGSGSSFVVRVSLDGKYPSSNDRRDVRVSGDAADDLPTDSTEVSNEAIAELIFAASQPGSDPTAMEHELCPPLSSSPQTPLTEPMQHHRSLSVETDDSSEPTRSRFDRWWINGVERCLKPIFSSSELHDDLCAEHRLTVPHHVVQGVIQRIHDDGPAAFSTVQPPVTEEQWREMLANRAATALAVRHDRYIAARGALRGLKRPATTRRRLARLVRHRIADQVVVDEDTAVALVELGTRLVLEGPGVEGWWDAPDKEPVEAALVLVCRFAIALAQGLPTFSGEAIDTEVIAAALAASLPSPAEAVGSMAFGDEIGPLGRNPDGGLISARARGGPVVAIGPPGQGKTQLLNGLLSTHRGAVMLTTTKPRDLKGWLDVRRGPTYLINATGEQTGGLERTCTRSGYNPLTDVRTVGDARKLAVLTVSKELGHGSGITDPDFWMNKAADLIWPILLFAAHTGEGMSRVYLRVLAEDFGDVLTWCRATDNQLALSTLESYTHRDSRFGDSIKGTAEAGLSTYADGLAGCVDELPPMDFKQAVIDGATIILVSNSRTAAQTKPYYVAVMDALITAAAELAADGWEGPKVRMLLDECANVVAHPQLPAISAIAPGMGVDLVAAFQDVKQISGVWGQRGIELLNNAGTILVFPGSIDVDLRQLIGSLDPPEVVRTPDGVPVGTTSGVPVLPPGPGELLVVDEYGRATRASQVVAYKEPAYVANRIECSLVRDPAFRELVASHLDPPAAEAEHGKTPEPR